MTPRADMLHLAWSQTWQVSVLILLVGGLSKVLSRSRPHLAFVLWGLVVVKCLLPPVWSSPTSVFSWIQGGKPRPLGVAQQMPPADRHEVADHAAFTATTHAGSSAGRATSTCQQPDAAVVRPAAPVRRVSPSTILIAVWLTGSLYLVSMVTVRWYRFRRMLGDSRVPTPPAINALVTQLTTRIGLPRRVKVLVTRERIAPCVFGVLHPVVVVPSDLAGARTAADLAPIVAHELVHLRRDDPLFSLLQVAAQVIWWFHPLVWWANRQVTRVTESCCDVEVLTGLGCQPIVYARCLLDVLEGRRDAIPACPGLQAAEVTSRRLEDIMSLTRKFGRGTRACCAAILIVLAFIVLPGAGLPRTPAGEPVEVPPASAGRTATAAGSVFPSQTGAMSRIRIFAPVDAATQGQRIWSVAFADEGRLVACAKHGGTVELLDAASGQLKSTLPVGRFPHAICGSSDPRTLLVLAGKAPAEVQFWDLESGQLDRTVTLEGCEPGLGRASFARGGSAVIVDDYKTISVWNTANGQLRLRSEPHTTPGFIEHHVKRLEEARASWKAKRLDEADHLPETSGKVLAAGDYTIGVREAVLSPNGDVAAFYVLLYDKTHTGIGCGVQLWDVSAGKLMHTLSDDKRSADAIVFSSSGQFLAVGEGRSVAIWDVAAGKLVQRMESGGIAVFAIAISPDEQILAGCSDGQVRHYRLGSFSLGETKIWNRGVGAATRTIFGGSGRGHSCDFSPDGNWIVRTDGSTVLALHVTSAEKHWLKPCGIFGNAIHPECLEVVTVPE